MRWDTLAADLRFAGRQLTKSPGFSAIAILTLALGIGANSALFSVVNSLLFRSPGYADPGRLVDVYTTSPNFRYATSSYPDYLDLRDQSRTFAGVVTYRFGGVGFSRGDEVRPVWSETVSGNYFDVVGVRPAVGRLLEPADDRTGAGAVAVLGHGFWVREFAGDRGVVGRTIRLNGHPFTVIGVTPESFHGMIRGLDPTVWVPSAGVERLHPGTTLLTARGNHTGFIRARLAPGATIAEAREEARAIGRRLAELYPGTNAGREFVVVPTAGVTLNPAIDGVVTGAAAVLLAIPALVLVIACANLATLLLTRAAGRGREIAVRLALGAKRTDVVRQLFLESLVLAIVGGVAGLVVAAWLGRALTQFQPPLGVPLSLDVAIDGRVVGFTILVTAITGVLFGLAPALRAGRDGFTADLREGARGATRRSRLQSVLVAAQMSVSLVLLVGCALLIRSLAGAARLDLGFDPTTAVTLQLDPAQAGYTGEKTREFYRQLLRRIRESPGVTATSLASRPPLNLNVSSNQYFVEGRSAQVGEVPEVQRSEVGPDYLAAVGGRLLAGRDFTEHDDADRPPVIIVNQSAARLLWPGEDPIGKRLAANDQGSPGRWREVVGLVQDIKVVTVGERPTPQVFIPVFQAHETYLTLIVRARGDPERLISDLRRIVRDQDAGMPVLASGTLADVVSTGLFPLRLAVGMLVVLGAVGLVIASVGLYGIVAQGVAQRTRELGVRLALGARGPDVLGMVFRDGLTVAGLGAAVGLVLAILGSRLLSGWLYGVSPYDPLAFTVAPLTLGLVTAVACWFPARRATRVDPVITLRAE